MISAEKKSPPQLWQRLKILPTADVRLLLQGVTALALMLLLVHDPRKFERPITSFITAKLYQSHTHQSLSIKSPQILSINPITATYTTHPASSIYTTPALCVTHSAMFKHFGALSCRHASPFICPYVRNIHNKTTSVTHHNAPFPHPTLALLPVTNPNLRLSSHVTLPTRCLHFLCAKILSTQKSTHPSLIPSKSLPVSLNMLDKRPTSTRTCLSSLISKLLGTTNIFSRTHQSPAYLRISCRTLILIQQCTPNTNTNSMSDSESVSVSDDLMFDRVSQILNSGSEEGEFSDEYVVSDSQPERVDADGNPTSNFYSNLFIHIGLPMECSKYTPRPYKAAEGWLLLVADNVSFKRPPQLELYIKSVVKKLSLSKMIHKFASCQDFAPCIHVIIKSEKALKTIAKRLWQKGTEAYYTISTELAIAKISKVVGQAKIDASDINNRFLTVQQRSDVEETDKFASALCASWNPNRLFGSLVFASHKSRNIAIKLAGTMGTTNCPIRVGLPSKPLFPHTLVIDDLDQRQSIRATLVRLSIDSNGIWLRDQIAVSRLYNTDKCGGYAFVTFETNKALQTAQRRIQRGELKGILEKSKIFPFQPGWDYKKNRPINGSLEKNDEYIRGKENDIKRLKSAIQIQQVQIKKHQALYVDNFIFLFTSNLVTHPTFAGSRKFARKSGWFPPRAPAKREKNNKSLSVNTIQKPKSKTTPPPKTWTSTPHQARNPRRELLTSPPSALQRGNAPLQPKPSKPSVNLSKNRCKTRRNPRCLFRALRWSPSPTTLRSQSSKKTQQSSISARTKSRNRRRTTCTKKKPSPNKARFKSPRRSRRNSQKKKSSPKASAPHVSTSSNHSNSKCHSSTPHPFL